MCILLSEVWLHLSIFNPLVQLLLSEGADPNEPIRVSEINNELFTSNGHTV